MNRSQGRPIPAPAQPAARIVRHSTRFKGDLKNAITHRKANISELKKVMSMIADRLKLDEKYLDHPLSGRYPKPRGFTDCRECHVCNDWLLVYRFPDDYNVHFIATGTHSDLLK